MELPQARPYGTQGRKPTHNFLSLYSPAQQDSSSTPPGGFLETHDFLQPLERIGKNVVKEGNKFEEQPAPVEHILPGGIGTYSISHVSSISQSQSQRMEKGEGAVITGAQSSRSDKNDENSNCSSYTGSGFSLWEESAVKKGGKENIAGSRRVIKEGGTKTEGLPSMKTMERPSQSSSAHNHPSTTVSSRSSSRLSAAPKNPNFVDLLNSAKSSKEDEENQEHEFVIKKEPPSHYKDATHHDQKPNTPRSKHSATEQRRRSKINDRFFKLRELIPHSDQKRDKASFLLEVIEYIRFLQEKVHKYEDSCRHKNNNNQRPTKGLMDQPLVQTGEQIGQHPHLTNKGSSFPSPLQSKIYSPGCISTSATAPLPSTLPAELANTTSQLRQIGSYTNDCNVTASDNLKDQEVTIESGTISISTVYSQGLLSTLTQALQNSGVDLSQASMSVQIDLGKRANPSTPLLKKNEISGVNDTSAHSRLASTLDEEKSDSTLKRLKTNRT